MIFAICVVSSPLYSQEKEEVSSKEINAKTESPFKSMAVDTINNPKLDSLAVKPADSVIKPKEKLDGIIEHTADSLIRQDIKNNKVLLYDNAHIHYTDIDLTAGFIEIDNNNNTITAKGIIDSLGNYSQLPVFKQGPQTSTQDSIKYNFKSEKAKIYNLLTEQEGLTIRGEVSKKHNDSVVFIENIKITSSQKEKPDYYISVKKAKFIQDSKLVAGTSQLIIQDVPTPIILPFAFIPLTKGKASGFILPTWGNNNQQGYFLQNGGYYLALNDYVDLAILADVYTNGSWGLRTESSYALKYKFSGNFSVRYENLINSLKGFDDYSKSTNYNIRWSHSQDQKSSPNSRFSASVNLGSSKYYRQSLNEFNNNSFLNNTLSSSVSYYRKLVGTPFNVSMSATHSQNTNTEQINMSLPSMLVNMDRIYPFASRSGNNKGAFRKMGLTYAMKGDVRINTTDEYFFKKEMWESANPGIQQNASLNTNAKLMKYFTLSPNVNYKEVWYFDRINKTYDEEDDTVVTDTISQFTTFREVSGGASLSTTVYGMVNFKKGNLQAIRHIVRPSVSYSYRPDLGTGYYEEVQQSADPDDLLEYSPYSNGIYGNPGKGVSNSLNFTLNNTLEAKVKPKDSTKTESDKITLLNNLNFTSSYNMALDSLKWSPIRMSAGTSIFKKKMQVNFNATMDPYALSISGKRINMANVKNGGSLLRLTNAGLTMNYSLSSKDNAKKSTKQEQNAEANNPDGIFGESLTTSNTLSGDGSSSEGSTKKAKLYGARFPWTLRLAYAINYTNTNRQNDISSNSLMFSGDVELTPKWNVGVSSGYDFKGKGFTYTQLKFSRDLDSWVLNFNWVPFGDRQTYYFFLGIKSSMLSDLKYDQRQLPDQRLF